MQILLKGKCLISVCDSSVTILYVLYGTYMHRSRTSMELSAALATQLWLVSIDGRKAKSGQFNWPNDCNESDNRKSVAHCVCVCMCLCVCVYNAAYLSDCQFEFYERAAGSSSIVNTFNTLMRANQDTIYEYTASDIHTYIVFISIYVEIGMHGHKSQSHAYEICINMSIKSKQSRPNAICLRPFRSAVMLQSNISRYQHRHLWMYMCISQAICTAKCCVYVNPHCTLLSRWRGTLHLHQAWQIQKGLQRKAGKLN